MGIQGFDLLLQCDWEIALVEVIDIHLRRECLV